MSLRRTAGAGPERLLVVLGVSRKASKRSAFKNRQGKLEIIIIINKSELVPKTKGLFTIKKRKGERFKSYDI